jgi:Zn-finger nucleic acid-binding protein
VRRATVETRYPCPVCLGTTLQKTVVTGKGAHIVLDSCSRCGGIWFELGEVQRLRAHPPERLWSRIQQRADMYRGPCHNCHTIIDRNSVACDACGTTNVIDCPVCAKPLTPETHEGMRLDVCRTCKGVWFDHVELAAIWTLSLDATRRGVASRRGASSAAETSASVLGDVLLFSPDLVFYGARAAGMAVEGGASMLANAPETATALAEGAGEAAAGVFEAVMEIIAGIFS